MKGPSIKAIVFLPLLALAVPVLAHDGDSTLVAPILKGIVIDGDLSDWPQGMEEHVVINHGQAYGPTDIDHANLRLSADLEPRFKIGYNPDDQLLYLAVMVRDDSHQTVEIDNPILRDQVEIYLDGDHNGGHFPPLNLSVPWKDEDPNLPQSIQYLGMAAQGSHHKGKRNYRLMKGDIDGTHSKMAYSRRGDRTTYEWALQVFDHYPTHPTRLEAGTSIGFDLVVADNDGSGDIAWVSWARFANYKLWNPEHLGDLVLGDTQAKTGHTPPLGRIVGHIDIPDLYLRARHNGELVALALADHRGRFYFNLPPGTYTIDLDTGQGFQAEDVEVAVELGAKTATALAATPIPTPTILERTRQRYTGLTAYADSFTVEIDGGLETTTATFAWAAPRYRQESVDWTSGNLTGLYSDGRQFAVYSSQFNQYIQQDAGKPSYTNLRRPLPGLRPGHQLATSKKPHQLLRQGLLAARAGGRQTVDDRPAQRLELDLAARSPLLKGAGIYQPLTVQLWLDEATGALVRAAYQLDQRLYSESYHRIEFNPDLADNYFRFAPPADAEEALYLGESHAYADIVGQPAPNFVLADPDSNLVRLADYAGQVVLIDFWGTWCPPCLVAMPYLIELQQQYAEHDVQIIAIAVRDTPNAVRHYAERNQLPFPVPLAAGNVQSQYQVANYPTSFFIDRQGTVRYAHKGFSSELLATYTTHIEELLAEEPSVKSD
ncbi:MAG: redoxin domain-containing protein [Candidatus Latescibacteria bacterium]|nr:redoxin domain-containing protein [Candidatus Latescibacterota bacterium]